MNNIQQTTRLVFLSVILTTSFANGSSAASSGSKVTVIATVSGQEVMINSDTGKSIQEKLKSAQEKLAAPLQKEGEKLQKEEQEIAEKEKSGKLDKSELEFAKREFGLKIQKLQAEGQKVEAKLGEMYQKEMGKFEGLVKDTIKELAQQNNWDIVLMEEQAVYVNKKAVSKTSEVMKKIDEKTKAANLAKKQALEKELEKEESKSKK